MEEVGFGITADGATAFLVSCEKNGVQSICCIVASRKEGN